MFWEKNTEHPFICAEGENINMFRIFCFEFIGKCSLQTKKRILFPLQHQLWTITKSLSCYQTTEYSNCTWTSRSGCVRVKSSCVCMCEPSWMHHDAAGLEGLHEQSQVSGLGLGHHPTGRTWQLGIPTLPKPCQRKLLLLLLSRATAERAAEFGSKVDHVALGPLSAPSWAPL